MKITLDLTRAEAHELNLLLRYGKAAAKPRRTTLRALTEWDRSYTEGMQRDA